MRHSKQGSIGPPRILRLHGRGEVLDRDSLEFPDPVSLPEQRRAIVRVAVNRIADSCGFCVPLMSYEGERGNSRAWTEGKLAKGGSRAIEEYMAQRNAESIDGLPAMAPAGALKPAHEG